MHLDMCFPREIAEAKKNNTPVVIVGGTVEYHGPQCSYGCDTLIAQGLVEKLAEKKDLPSATVLPAMLWVMPPAVPCMWKRMLLKNMLTMYL